MRVPKTIRSQVKTRLWEHANRIGWATLSPTDKAKHYENWTSDEAIGGILSRFMDKGQIRVYLKDTLLKDFARTQASEATSYFRLAGIPADAEVARSYVKPHGKQLADGRLICWGKADAWKTILLGAHERVFGEKKLKAHAVIFSQGHGRYYQPEIRCMIDDAARKLNIEKIIWTDNIPSGRPTKQNATLGFDGQSSM